MMEKINSYCDDNTLIRNNPTLKNPLALKLELTFSMAKSFGGRGNLLLKLINLSLFQNMIFLFEIYIYIYIYVNWFVWDTEVLAKVFANMFINPLGKKT